MVAECIRVLKAPNGQIHLCWVPGHNDIDRNDKAGELSRGEFLMEPAECRLPQTLWHIKFSNRACRVFQAEIVAVTELYHSY